MRDFFGLFVHVYYWIMSSDLQWILDVLNLVLYVLCFWGCVVVVIFVVKEGFLLFFRCEVIVWGEVWIWGYVFFDILILYVGWVCVGILLMIRSVCIVIYFVLCWCGLVIWFIEYVYVMYVVEDVFVFFGMFFGVIWELLCFWWSVGY